MGRARSSQPEPAPRERAAAGSKPAAIQRPVTFAMVQVNAAPDLWRELVAEDGAQAA